MEYRWKNQLMLLIAALFLIFAVGCAEQERLPETEGVETFNKAVAVLHPTEGNNVRGVVTFTNVENGVRIVAEVEGLTPGDHGFHIHEFGDCSALDAQSAGGHFNPENMPHGGPDNDERHVGDLGNITADETGKARYDRVDTRLALNDIVTGAAPQQRFNIIGRALIIHQDRDDLTSQPTGNAGARVACGVIGIAKTE